MFCFQHIWWTSGVIEDLRSDVVTGYNESPHSRMTATGIPPYVIMQQLTDLIQQERESREAAEDRTSRIEAQSTCINCALYVLCLLLRYIYIPYINYHICIFFDSRTEVDLVNLFFYQYVAYVDLIVMLPY